jgi:hypothetical protein
MAESRWGRLGAVSGIVFAVLFVLGILLPGLPNSDEPEAFSDFYANGGDRAMVVVSAYLLIFAGIAFLAFAANLYRGMREAEGDSGSLATVALGAGIVFVTMLYSGAASWANVPAGIEFGGEAQPANEIPIWFNQLGFGQIMAPGMFAAITVIVCTSILVLRTAVLPRWLAWTGFVCAPVLVLGVVFLPMIALPIWTVATGVAMLKSPAPSAAPIRQPAARAA